MYSELAAISNDKIKILGIETLEINPKDTIILTVDTDLWNAEEISSVIEIFGKAFPQNTTIAKLKGFDVEVDKCQ